MKADHQKLFFEVVRAVTFEDLRLKPRERLLVLILAIESFGEGREFGLLHVRAWRFRLPSWRLNELWNMLSDFERKSWIAVDLIEGTYRLAPDRLPGWRDAIKRQLHEVQMRLPTADDLKKIFAKISQDAACPPVSHDGEPPAVPEDTESPIVSGDSLRSEVRLPLINPSPPLRNFRTASGLKDLKGHKGCNLLQDLTVLKGLLLAIEFGPEQKAYEGMRGIVGFDVMEGGDLDRRTGQPRLGDGGKWRNRWRTNRRRVHQMFAALVEEISTTNPPKSRGARIEYFWRQAQGVSRIDSEVKP